MEWSVEPRRTSRKVSRKGGFPCVRDLYWFRNGGNQSLKATYTSLIHLGREDPDGEQPSGERRTGRIRIGHSNTEFAHDITLSIPRILSKRF